MSMGRQARERQRELWVAADALPAAPRHVFYDRLNGLLSEAGEACRTWLRGLANVRKRYVIQTVGPQPGPPDAQAVRRPMRALQTRARIALAI